MKIVGSFNKSTGFKSLLLLPYSFCWLLSFAQTGINGVVKSGNDVLPLATISISNKTVLTDSGGKFLITIGPGTYTLQVTHVGYKKIEQLVTVDSTQTKFIQFIMMEESQLGEIVVLGSRSAVQRSSLNTAVPVDVSTSKDLQKTNQHTLIQMLNFTLPSFNVSRQSLFEPVTIRGLGPDHLLILVNGNRLHNSAFVNNNAIKGTLGLGSVTNDINSIPFTAIEKIEILRDGATAQYGSDAIAGVMNMVLKKTTGKTFINLQVGQCYKGDGKNLSLGINRGISIAKKGYLNVSGDFRYRLPTHRGGQYEGTVYYNIPQNASSAVRDSITALDNNKIQERGFSRKTPVSNDGSAQLSSLGFLINGGYPVKSNVHLFWTGSINYRDVVNQGTYRYPKTISQVNTALHPDGFKVKSVIDSRDISLIAGAKGKTSKAWAWEWSSAYGENSNKTSGRNTNNASQFMMGANAPTEFYGGRLVFKQQINTVGFAKDLAKKIKAVKSFTVGFGAEYRFENYLTKAGEEASWKDYDSSGPRSGGAQGSGGINLSDVVNEARHIAGSYIDVETDVNDHLLFNVAARYEWYNDFGNSLAGKLAVRYKFSSAFLIRGSISNGFHAPALQQIYLTATGFAWRNTGGTIAPVSIGTFSNNSDVSRVFGIMPLQPEKAINMSGGFTSRISSHLNVTTDAYWVQIKNRIVLSGIFDKTNPDVYKLLQNRSDIDQVQFMTNAINTKTYGIDVVLNGNWTFRKSNLGMSAAANFTKTELFGPIEFTNKLPSTTENTNTLFNREEREKIEHGQPSSKIIFSATYYKGKTGILFRSTRFGKTSAVLNSANPLQDEFFSAKTLTDVSFSYTPKSWVTITAGANNVFDVYPDPVKNPINKNQGVLIYSNQGTPFGYNGGYYFLAMNFSW